MYAFETISEKALNSIQKKLMSKQTFSNNKWAKAAFYVLKGSAFVLASLGGYTIGSKGGESLVDSARDKKAKKLDNGDSFKKSVEKATEEAPVSVFADIEML
jgi:hypothetical protein